MGLTAEKLAERVEDVLASAGDDEVAHSMEDDLHLDVIRQFCPKWVVDEIARLSDAEFARWCA